MMMGDQAPILPPGFRFHPTDEELVTYYLVNKVLDRNFNGRVITEVDLNKCEPWNLPEKAKVGEKEWYFFSLRDRKYPTGLRTNRATNSGYWKATGKDREIFNSSTSELVGMKKTLVFYRGRAPKGEKSNWVMHEYRLDGNMSYHHICRTTKDEWVICRVYHKSSSSSVPSSSPCGKNAPVVSAMDSLYPSRLPALVHKVQEENHPREHVPCFSTDSVSHVYLNPQMGSLQMQTKSEESARQIEFPTINSYQTSLGFNGGVLGLGFPFGFAEIGSCGGGSGGSESNHCPAVGFLLENAGRAASSVMHPSSSSSSSSELMRSGMLHQIKEYKVPDSQCFGFH